MKKTPFTAMKAVFALTIFFASLFCSNVVRAESASADIIYAYLPSAVMLYNKTDEGAYEPVTLLPPTYFVALLQEPDSVGEYIKVSYADLSGYVKKADIEICDYEPVTKYCLGSAKISFDGQPVNLRSVPDHTTKENIIHIIPSDEAAEYYGSVEGSALYPQLGRTWYYIRYKNGEEYLYGYIYSAQLIVERIEENTIEKVVKPTPQSPDADITNPADNLSDPATYIIIACLTIPAILIMIFLFQKPSKPRRKPRHT